MKIKRKGHGKDEVGGWEWRVTKNRVEPEELVADHTGKCQKLPARHEDFCCPAACTGLATVMSNAFLAACSGQGVS